MAIQPRKAAGSFGAPLVPTGFVAGAEFSPDRVGFLRGIHCRSSPSSLGLRVKGKLRGEYVAGHGDSPNRRNGSEGGHEK